MKDLHTKKITGTSAILEQVFTANLDSDFFGTQANKLIENIN